MVYGRILWCCHGNNDGIIIITALPRPFLSLHVTGNKLSIN